MKRTLPERRRVRLLLILLGLLLCLAAVLSLREHHTEEPQWDTLPYVEVNGVKYLSSSHGAVFEECPPGFVYGGETELDGESVPCYVNPAMPEWVYLYQTCWNQWTREYYPAYVRYVEETLRGLTLLRYDGQLYARLLDVDYLLLKPAYQQDAELVKRFDSADTRYGWRFEGAAPAGFSPLGITVFEGYDTIPSSELGVNFLGKRQVWCSSAEPDVLLVEADWSTHSAQEDKETRHSGFQVYIRFDYQPPDASLR